MKTLIVIISLFISTSLFAQKKPYYNSEEEIVEAAYLHLDSYLKSEDMVEWVADNNIKGDYSLMITIGGNKGAVYTVRPNGRSEDASIPNQNALKDNVKTMRFPFKMPKDKSYQFQYDFKF